MRICYNASAMIANNALNKNDNRLAQSLQRLSSGLKVVEAKNNPAGMAMGKRMNTQLTGISSATQNSNDAISVIETADGALTEVHDILQRLNELGVKASTGTLSESDREIVQKEAAQLKEEITRIAATTQFNGQTLLDGNFDLKGYSDVQAVKVGYYSDQVTPGIYGIGGFVDNVGTAVTQLIFDADGNIDQTLADSLIGGQVTGLPIGGPNADVNMEFKNATITAINGNKITIKSDVNADFEINLKFKGDNSTPPQFDFTTLQDGGLELNITGIGAMTMQTGAREGQVLDIRIPTVSLEEMGIKNLDMSKPETALEAIDNVAGAIQYISEVRSRLGAYQNRLEHTISNLDITNENMTAAYSRIMDVDMAEEMTEYTTVQVITQASMSMLAQANERPAQVLQLLQ